MKKEKLKNITTQIRGVSYKKGDALSTPEDSHIALLRANNIQDGALNESELLFVPSKLVNEKQLIQKGDIVIAASSGSINIVGKAGFSHKDTNSTFGAFCKLIRPIKDRVIPEYLNFFFQSHEYRTKISLLAQGANINNLRNEHVDELEIILPSIPEQKRIATILDKADALRQKNKQLLAAYDEFLQSTFLDMFGDPGTNPKGWEKMNGEEYCVKITVGVVIKPASYYVDSGVIALRSLNIKPNEIDLSNLVYFSQKSHESELSKSKLKTGDVVFVRTGVTGTAAVIPEELDGCNCIDLIIARPDTTIMHSKYLTFLFNSEGGKKLVNSKEVGGIQKHFNIGAIKKLKIPIPPVELQKRFAEIVANIEAQKSILKQSIRESEDLFNGLVQKAFKGELNEQ